MKNRLVKIIILHLMFLTAYAASETIAELEKKADEHFTAKEFNSAIALWMDILNRDPDNDRVQKKIETVFEIKQKKDLTLERARLDFRISRDKLQDDKQLNEGIKRGKASIENFISAYRLDPNDSKMQQMIEEMRLLEQEVKAAEEKEKVAWQKRERARQLKELASAEMKLKNPDYGLALKYWKEVLDIFPNDVEAAEGERRSKIAIDNIIKYEKIREFISRGDDLFRQENYTQARAEFQQALSLDTKNREARDKISAVDDKILSARNFEQRKSQAENYYLSGIRNINENNFDAAKDDFESALALIENYRDSKEKLASLDRLQADYKRRMEQNRLNTINREFQSGLLSFQDGRYREAIYSFETTIRLDPGNDMAKQYLERARDGQKNLEEETVDRNSPYYDIVQSLSASGKKLYDSGDFIESKKRWGKILDLFPSNRMAKEYILKCDYRINPELFKVATEDTVKKGKDDLKARRFELALSKFELIKAASPDYPGLDNLIAQAKAGAKRPEVNLAAVDRNEIEARYRRGLVLFQQGGKDNYQKALTEFKWIVGRDPNHIQALTGINRIESQLRGGGQIQEAGGGRKLTPEQERVVKKHYYAGIGFYSNNDYNNAIAEWRKVLAVDPNHIQARSNIRKCLALMAR
jgi:tetratricopeptide (TPR) repeat protein